MKQTGKIWSEASAVSALCLCVAFLAVVAVTDARGQESKVIAQTDAEYEQLLQDNPQYANQIQQVDSLLAVDEELEESYLAYEESLEDEPELVSAESTYVELLEEDEELAERLAAYEEEAASDPEALEQMTAMDSLLASDPGFAERVKELEEAAAEDPDLIESHGDQIRYIESNPEVAEEFYSDEAGPTYTGDDPDMILYVNYLVTQPRLYRAHWRLHRYLLAHPPLAAGVYVHWRWYGPRRALWRSWWNYRFWTARDARIHRIVWHRRVLLGSRPWIAWNVRHHRFVVARRPAVRHVVWKHHVFAVRHRTHARSVVKHRNWVKVHHPRVTKAKPVKVVTGPKKAPKVKAKTAPKVKAKTTPKAKSKTKAKPKKKK